MWETNLAIGATTGDWNVLSLSKHRHFVVGDGGEILGGNDSVAGRECRLLGVAIARKARSSI